MWGVENGKDAFEHLLCGAQMVQVGTQLMKEGLALSTEYWKS